VSDRPIKRQNPQIGAFRIRYRGKNKRYTKTLGKAFYFEVVLPSGKKIKAAEFPANLRVIEKKEFLQYFLYRIIRAQEERREAARKRYAKSRAERGFAVRSRGRKSPPVEQVLGTTKRRLAELSARDRIERAREAAPKIEREIEAQGKQVIFDTITDSDFFKADRAYRRFLRKTDYLLGQLGVLFEVTSEGKAIPTRTIDGKKVRTMSWYEHQRKIGLITDVNENEEIGQNSIWWIVSRILKRFGKAYFKGVAEEFGFQKELIFKVSLITNLAKHEGKILSSAPEYAEEMQLPQEQTAQFVRLAVNLEAEDFQEEFERFQAAVVKVLILTLYGPNVYQSASDKMLTSSDALFRLPLENSGSRGKTAMLTKLFKVAFTLNLTMESS
jgi:hypothetical protein